MNIGSLYTVKKWSWSLFPTKETAAAAADAGVADAATPAALLVTARRAAVYSKHFKCNVSYIKPNSVFCLLEKDEKLLKILSTNGELGWIILDDWCKDGIEEVTIAGLEKNIS
jgi:hypothetical protein